MLRLYSTTIFFATTGVAFATEYPTVAAVPGPVAGVGLPILLALGGYALYKKYRKS
jgi:hypothetical protein